MSSVCVEVGSKDPKQMIAVQDDVLLSVVEIVASQALCNSAVHTGGGVADPSACLGNPVNDVLGVNSSE